MPDAPGTSYVDTAAAGAPGAMAEWLSSLGYRPDDEHAIPEGSPVRAFLVRPDVDAMGNPLWCALIRALTPITRPDGIVQPPAWAVDALVGGFSGATARTRTKVSLYERMTDAELTVLNALLGQVAMRQRMSWMDATVIEIDRADVRQLAAAAFGAERAAEILG